MNGSTTTKWLSLCLLLFLLAACSRAEPQTLTVFAASSLTDAFGEIAAAFETAHPDTEIVLNFAGSQALRSQIEFGAAVDVFASADFRQMQALVDGGLVAPEAVKPFLTNQLVLITPPDNPQRILSLADLTRDGVAIIVAAPDVPAGAYTRDALAELTTTAALTQILANVVSEELNVRQVLAKIALGEADAGFVYVSDVVAVGEESVNAIPLPIAPQKRPTYPIAVLKGTSAVESADAFVAFVLADEGQQILQKWGFGEPTGAPESELTP